MHITWCITMLIIILTQWSFMSKPFTEKTLTTALLFIFHHISIQHAEDKLDIHLLPRHCDDVTLELFIEI